MKFKSLILLIVSLFILFSCDSGVKLNNPNDPNNRISQGMGESGKECYPNNTCNKGLVCDEESNTCIKDPENADEDKTDTASENDDEDKTDTASTNDEDMNDSEQENTNDDDSSVNPDTDNVNNDEDHKIPAGEEQVTKEIYANEGGTITNSDGSISIEIPADALAQNTLITMTVYNEESYPAAEDEDIVSKIVEFEPSGTIFRKPFIITLKTIKNVEKKIITAAVYNEAEGRWSYSEHGAYAVLAGKDTSGNPIITSPAGDPIMLNAAGDPIMMSAAGDPIMMAAAGDPIMLASAGDPIMTNAAAGDPIMMTTGHFTAFTFIALEPEEAENHEGDDEISDEDTDTEIFPDEDGLSCMDTCTPLVAECLPAMESESNAGLCNGLDDDCDGKVDEGCPCSPGQTQPCFSGPRNFRNIGTCQDGVQTCKFTLGSAIGSWGECEGGINPSSESCDNADNNCNGCIDDNLCCTPPIDCSFDIGTALPFADKIIDGKQIYDTSHQFNDADTATWEWTLTQGPCDIVLDKVNSYMKGAKTQEELGSLAESDRKILLNGIGLSQLKLRFRLSGQYTLHLKVTHENGEIYECEWVLKVASDGLRIELCWDTTGSVDVDLHMGKNGTTSSWTSSSGSPCYYGNCKVTSSGRPDWGYGNTMNYDKEGNYKSLPNPRLDIDNISTPGEPENINVDNPNNGDTFRVLVRHYSGTKTFDTHPVVNVYCGGTLKATYGVEPQVTGYRTNNDSWKVVEIKWVGDYASDACELTPQWNDSTGYVVNKGSVPDYTSW